MTSRLRSTRFAVGQSLWRKALLLRSVRGRAQEKIQENPRKIQAFPGGDVMTHDMTWVDKRWAVERCAVTKQLLVLIAALAAPAAQAQAPFPTHPITMVVPLPAGGTADLLCRLAADKAGGILGQQIVIENRAGGAGGRIGTETVMRSAPDGYTILCAPQLNYSITHLVFTKSSFDTRSMEPVSVLAVYPLTLLARGNFPADDLPGFIAYAKANADKVNYGHQGK